MARKWARLVALTAAAGELEVGLVHQRGGLQRVAAALAVELAVGDPAEVFVHQRDQPLQGAAVARLDGLEQPGDFAWSHSGVSGNGSSSTRYGPFAALRVTTRRPATSS